MEFIPLDKIVSRGEKSISPRALYSLLQPLVEALIEWRDSGLTGHSLNLQSIELSSDGKHVRIVDASSDEAQNIINYGHVLRYVIPFSTLSSKRLATIAQQCCHGKVANLETLHLMLERMVSSTIYKILLAILITGFAILAIYQLLH